MPQGVSVGSAGKGGKHPYTGRQLEYSRARCVDDIYLRRLSQSA